MIAPVNQWFLQLILVCLGQTCLVPSLRLTRRLRKKKLRERRIGQNALHRVISRLFPRVGCSLSYIEGFLSYQWLIFHVFAGDAGTIPGVSGNEDVSTGVETDGQLRGRHIVVTRSLVPLAGEAVHSRGRSRELLKRAFDDRNNCVQMRNLLVLIYDDSKFLPHLCLLDQFITDLAATVIRVTGPQMVSLCRSVCEKEKAQLLSPLMKS